jgi:histidinol-phosphate aminotransferase
LRSAENPYGPPPAAFEAAQRQLATANRYPRKAITELRALIADDVGLTPEHVAIGAGSIELMLGTGLALGKPGRAVLSGDPTWSTTVAYAAAHGAEWIRVPLTSAYRYDFPRMLAAINDKVDLVYVCHPNNPTGLAEEHAALEAFVRAASARTLVMVDEAFLDCLEHAEALSMKKLVKESDNVVIARTFSKLWGMAGFRVGYMIGPPKFLAQIKSALPKLEMQNSIGCAAAMAAYVDQPFIAASRQRMRAARNTIFEILDRRGLKYIRSDSNFVSFQVPEEGTTFVAKMEGQGVSLKAVALAGDTRWARVSCGTPEELAAFERALAAV